MKASDPIPSFLRDKMLLPAHPLSLSSASAFPSVFQVYLSILLFAFLPSTVAAADTTVVVTATSTQSPAPVPTSPSYTTPSLMESSFLNSTNTYRYQHGSLAVSWNDSLADIAQSYSSNCQFKHSETEGIGENLAMGYTDVTAAVDAWGQERDLYTFGDTMTGDGATGFEEETGHFTQLVWKGTIAVGCGVTECDGKNKVSGWLVICEYWPPGNIIAPSPDKNSLFASNVGEQATDDQMPDGWQETARATATDGVGVTPAGPRATITAGMISGAKMISAPQLFKVRSDLRGVFWTSSSWWATALCILSVFVIG